ncbi:uncharacterized protein LOC144173702 [Haemaphysalis longicornis]
MSSVDGDTSEDEDISEDSSDEERDSLDYTKTSLSYRLRGWASSHNISHAALNALLRILKEKDPDLPTDARTLLETPRVCPIRQLANGEYVHFGLKPALTKCLSSGLLVPDGDVLHLTLNVDGLPLFHDSNQQLWPILAVVSETRDGGPFPIGVFSAKKKPTNITGYLDEFVQEMQETLNEGVEYLVKKWQVVVRAVVCDYPARVFVNCTKGHSAYYGCDKCTQKGQWENKLTFPDTQAPLRDDASFVARLQEQHHTGDSPFELLGLGMVTQFPIDYMHLVLLGVVRRFVKYWASGPLTVRRSDAHINMISDRIALLYPYTPCDFSRKLRTLHVGEKWKATEARLFLLYACPSVLKRVLSDESYNHFMTLHVAIRILCMRDCPEHLLSYADQLLKYFVEKAASKQLYGVGVHVYNVHGLIHLAQDVRAFGPLDSFSSFPFENYLGILKRKVRSGNKPLAQVFKRLSELEKCKSRQANVERTVFREHMQGPVPAAFINARQFSEVVFHGHTIKTAQGDNCVLLTTDESVVVDNILSHDRKLYIVGRHFRIVQDLYTYPCRSSLLGVVMVSSLSAHSVVYKLSDIKAKCFLYPRGNAYACLPILHSVCS